MRLYWMFQKFSSTTFLREKRWSRAEGEPSGFGKSKKLGKLDISCLIWVNSKQLWLLARSESISVNSDFNLVRA